MLGRTIDRARASLPGGALGPYIPVDRGLSAMFLGMLEVPPAEFVAAVAGATAEEDVLRWLEARVAPTRIAAAAQRLTTFRIAEIPAHEREHVAALYPADLFASCETAFELIEADDRRFAGASA